MTFTNNDKTQEFVITLWREESNQVGNEVNEKSNQVNGIASNKTSLTNKQKDIVNFCSVPRTTAEIMNRLGVTNQTKNRERYITFLIDAGLLEMTNPDNPTASNQKYRKVNKRTI